MEASHDALPVSRGRAVQRRLAVVVLALVTGAVLPAASGAAAGAPEPKKDVKKELAELQKKADALNKEYRGELLSLSEAKKAADRAAADADRVSREWSQARTDVSRIAATAYINGSMDAIPIVTGGDPDNALKDAVVLQHISRNNGLRVQNLQTLAAQAAKSRQEAKAKVAEVRKQVAELESRRTKVKKLLAKFKPEKPAAPRNGRPDGAARGGKSPIIGNSMTSRMRGVLLAIDNRYGPFSVIGCYRAGDPQDHGSGHACDFMESTGGRMPSAGAQAHGDSVAQYAISNASSLGVKYVIWKQRIWDVRSGGGWRAMENRGSITANHYDHVHISVL